MKILTLNCQHGYRREALDEFLKNIIKSNEYDFILLQELDLITRELFTNSQYSIAKTAENEESHSYVGIAYKKQNKLEKTIHLHFSRQITLNHKYNFGFAAIEINGLVVGTVHMPAYFVNFIKRRFCLMKILKKLDQEFEGKKIIVGGDWNTLWKFESIFVDRKVLPKYRLCKVDHFTYDTSRIEKGLFWNNVAYYVSKIVNTNFNIDYFFTNIKIRKEPKMIDIIVSDHYPVEIEF